MINILANSLKNLLNKANPNELADYLRMLGFGDVLRQSTAVQLRNKIPAADSYNLATVSSLALPDDARAAVVLRACAKTTSAAGTLGELAPQAFAATPADAQIAVSPNGQIVTLASSAYTKVDCLYIPEKYDVVEFEVGITSANTIAIGTPFPGLVSRGIAFLMEAEATAGTVTGKKIILVPGAGAPAAGQCRLNLAKDTVTFNSGTDVVTKARLKLAVSSAIDVDALLEALTNF